MLQTLFIIIMKQRKLRNRKKCLRKTQTLFLLQIFNHIKSKQNQIEDNNPSSNDKDSAVIS